MRKFRIIFMITFLVGWSLLQASPLIAQEKFTVLTGKVIGIRARMWLDVESEKDKAIVNFRIGRRTVYNPHRYPFAGERVKVEYLIQRGIPVAYKVTILESGGKK